MTLELKLLLSAYALSFENSQLRTNVASLEAEVERLKELVQLQQDKLYGKKTEANLSKAPSNKDKPNATTHVSVKAHTRKKRGPRQFEKASLPRHTIVHDLIPEEQICPCGHALHLVGKESAEQLEMIPARYFILEHLRMKYGCRKCETIKMAPKKPAPLPKAIAGPGLLTDVILSKYQYHLPLYRQSKILQSHGIDISDKTLSNWVMTCGEGLLKIYDVFWEALEKRYLQVDETPIKILSPNKKGYMWTYFSPNAGRGLVAFEFSETREGRVAFERLKNFKGLVQTDAYSGYSKLRDKEDIIALGCLAHARRKFAEVVKISADKNGLAAQMIQRIKPLYELEDKLRKANAAHRTRKYFRRKIARPILKEIHKWLLSIQDSAPHKSKLGQAISYALNQWSYLIKYVEHGMAEIDNNEVENKIRHVALGRRNWLFIGNRQSGKIHAAFYTLIMSAILNDINPRVYIQYLISKIHDLRLNSINPMDLLPDRVDLNLLQDFATEQIQFGRTILNNAN